MDYGWHDFVGNLGVVCVLGSYFLLQTGRLRADTVAYGVINATGAVLIGISLLYDFNLSSMIIEIAWFTISVFGIVRVLRLRRSLS